MREDEFGGGSSIHISDARSLTQIALPQLEVLKSFKAQGDLGSLTDIALDALSSIDYFDVSGASLDCCALFDELRDAMTATGEFWCEMPSGDWIVGDDEECQ